MTHRGKQAKLSDKKVHAHCYEKEVARYDIIKKIGEGSYGEVFKARDKKHQRIVALKKMVFVKNCKEFPSTAVREVRILQNLRHENVVKMHKVCSDREPRRHLFYFTFHLVLEFCELDILKLVLNKNLEFSLGHIKQILLQLLNALSYIHTKSILHCDIKPSNILVKRPGVVKLADFGLSRVLRPVENSDSRENTLQICSLWYKPPELLLGDTRYGFSLDMWGVGCVMAEFWTRSPIMRGKCETEQIEKIADLCGHINPVRWPGVEKLPKYPSLSLPQHTRKVSERIGPLLNDPYALDLLERLITLNPTQRINSKTALTHEFFKNEPLPSDLGELLSNIPEDNRTPPVVKFTTAQLAASAGPTSNTLQTDPKCNKRT